MAHYKVVLAYDGTDFCGFQRQASESKKRTIQAEVEAALKQLGWRGQSILAAGRTDSGVHAMGQVVAFDLEWRHSLDDLRSALNAKMPSEIAALQVCQTATDFHPRYDAWARCYHYRIICQPVRNPLLERYAWRVWPSVDLDRLQRAATCLLGSHDFGAFGSAPSGIGSTERMVFHAQWRDTLNCLTFEIIGNAFLYHMVRRLVHYQVEIGKNRLDVASIQALLQNGAGEMVKGLAPANGLTLTEVFYTDETLT